MRSLVDWLSKYDYEGWGVGCEWGLAASAHPAPIYNDCDHASLVSIFSVIWILSVGYSLAQKMERKMGRKTVENKKKRWERRHQSETIWDWERDKLSGPSPRDNHPKKKWRITCLLIHLAWGPRGYISRKLEGHWALPPSTFFAMYSCHWKWGRFRIDIPVDTSGCALTHVFGDAWNIFIGFVGEA